MKGVSCVSLRIHGIAVFCAIASLAVAEAVFPKPGWKDAPDPLAAPNAVPGGEVSNFSGQSPKSLNYYLDNSVTASDVFSRLFETLLAADPITYEDRPALANKWSISDDQKVFTLWLDPKAKWSDGRPVTAEDVKWTFDAILDPKNLTGPFKTIMEPLNSPDILDERTVRFTAKEVHWRNLEAIGGFPIMAKHAYAGKDFNLIHFEFPVVSGPYRLGEWKEGLYVTIIRRPDWWAIDLPSSKGTHNFQTIRFKFMDDRNNAFEAFKKGELDIYPVYTSRIWVNETSGGAFDKNWIVKQNVHNYEPARMQGWAMNMRKPPFDDVRVRKAMAMLLNRWKMNETIMYNQYKMHKAYWEDLYDAEHPCPREPLPFDKTAARQLLAEAGWRPNPQTGVLEKDGKPFVFRMLERDPAFAKFNAIYAEDLKEVGIRMEVDQKDWASWVKDMDNFNFEMTSCAWGSSIRKDPEMMWHSKTGKVTGGNNYCGFADPAVDALIEQQKTIFDITKRHDICRQIDQMLYDQHPYALSWYADSIRMLYWAKFGTPPTVLTKFGAESGALTYWWYDEDAAAELQDAMANNRSLPKKEFEVYFDKTFKR